jgi:hypothetical protein
MPPKFVWAKPNSDCLINFRKSFLIHWTWLSF